MLRRPVVAELAVGLPNLSRVPSNDSQAGVGDRQSNTLKVEASGQGEKVTTEGVNAEGGRTATQYTANYDGKDYPLTGSQIANTVSLKRIDARTTERTDKKDGKVVMTLTRVVSQDGKTMTVTAKGTNAQGQTVNNVAFWEKQ
jgi:hypothetical protein